LAIKIPSTKLDCNPDLVIQQSNPAIPWIYSSISKFPFNSLVSGYTGRRCRIQGLGSGSRPSGNNDISITNFENISDFILNTWLLSKIQSYFKAILFPYTDYFNYHPKNGFCHMAILNLIFKKKSL